MPTPTTYDAKPMMSYSRQYPGASAIQIHPSSRRLSMAMFEVQYCNAPLSTLYPSSTCHVVPHTNSSSIYRTSSNPEMTHTSTSSPIQPLFNAALQDYANQTGIKLDEHPLAQQLENCDSVDSITSVLQEHARKFHEFRGEDGKIMKSLKCAVHVLYTLSTSTTLGEGIGLVYRKSPIAILCS